MDEDKLKKANFLKKQITDLEFKLENFHLMEPYMPNEKSGAKEEKKAKIKANWSAYKQDCEASIRDEIEFLKQELSNL